MTRMSLVRRPAACLLPLLWAASAGAQPAPNTPATATRPATPPARVQSLPGLEGVIGADAGQLTRMFGAPRLDVVEGDARKLQFSATACVLDVYLYPPAPGQVPRASYVDARRAADARDVDRAACVAAMKKR